MTDEVYVLAMVLIKPGQLSRALAVYREFVPQVLAREVGCIAYVSTIDVDSGLANQRRDPALIRVFERWRRLDDFRSHIDMPHTRAFRAKIAELLAEPIAITVTRDALPASAEGAGA